MKFNAYNDFKNFGKLSLTYSFQYNHRQEYDVRVGDLNKLPALDMALITNQFNINHLLNKDNWSLESGIDGTYQNNYSDPATKARRLILIMINMQVAFIPYLNINSIQNGIQKRLPDTILTDMMYKNGTILRIGIVVMQPYIRNLK